VARPAAILLQKNGEGCGAGGKPPKSTLSMYLYFADIIVFSKVSY
jgi:hypothetical protein